MTDNPVNRQRLDASEAVDRLLHPRAVALIGASNDEEKFSGQPLRNLRSAGYPGDIYPVNRRGGEVGGIPALTDLADLPVDVDVALVMVPAESCVEAVRRLGEVGVPVAIIAVSGFAEMGTALGGRLQEELGRAGREAGVRLVGPNCNGLYETRVPLPLGYNHTHSQVLRAGSVALISHSGALFGGFAPLLESYGEGVSAFVSCGNEVDLGLIDYMDHFLEDEQTKVIALILDGVSDGARFRCVLHRARAVGKPVVALKLGNTLSGTSAAQAHSSRLAGTQASYEAVFAADGVVSVPTLETLAVASALLAAGRTPRHPDVTCFNTSGAGGILMADTLGAHGIALTRLSAETETTMSPLAGFARVMNPFDIGAAGPVTIEQNIDALASDVGTGSLLFYLTPTPTRAWRQALADGVATVGSRHSDLPILVVSPAPISAEESRAYAAVGVPVMQSVLDATAALKALVDAAGPAHRDSRPAPVLETSITGRALSEPASKQYLFDRGLPILPELLVTTADEARKAATEIGYPLVAKAAGAGLTHKTENKLVALNVPDEHTLEAVFDDLARRGRLLDPAGYEGVLISRFMEAGVEVVVGVSVDPDFGPMIMFGSGGVLAELIADVAVAPAPLDVTRARTLVSSTKVARLLAGYRGSESSDVDALIDLVVRLSQVAVDEAGALEAIDLNPVRVLPAGRGVAILDALVVEAS